MIPAAVLVTVIAYFLVLYLVASLSGRRADNQGFFVGNRRSPWPVVAFAMIGSSISGVTFVSVPGWVQASQFSYLQMALGFVAGQLVIAFVLIPLFYRMGLVSIYQYLESRFGISSYRTGAWFFFLSKMIGAAVRVYLVCLVMQLLVFGPLHVPFVWNVAATMILVWLYTHRGGVKSLIWTDSLKTFCLVASVGLDLFYRFGPAFGFRRCGRRRRAARLFADFLFRRSERPAVFLQAVSGRSLHRDRDDRARPGHDAAQPELPQLPRFAEEHRDRAACCSCSSSCSFSFSACCSTSMPRRAASGRRSAATNCSR